LARSFQLMIKAHNEDVLRILANAAACISEGEVLQLSLCHNLDVRIEDSLRVIEAKTATLFAAACEVGAIMATQPSHSDALRDYGLNLGMAFQIVDDILDYAANEDQLGKEIGNDFREGKITLPVVLIYPLCQPDEKDFLRRTLVDHDQATDDLHMILKILHKYKGIDKAYQLATDYGEKARQALNILPEHPIKRSLTDLINCSLERQC
jgi:octaprenyl-diphosphate synthase